MKFDGDTSDRFRYTYDAIGNPRNDGTWNYTWAQGCQLRGMYKGSFGASGYDEISFKYNQDGLRTQKTRMYYDEASGDIGYQVTDYTLLEPSIVHLTSGGNNLHFFYDEQNKPAMVAYNGLLYSNAYNLEGDVTALLDANGTVVVEYRYDAWGKPINKTGLMADTLGTLNPFRYRGYVYDEETGVYYLQSRYYNPTWGRFVNADSVVFAAASHNRNNLYSYCKDNPVNYADENGRIAIAVASYPILEMFEAAGVYLLKILGLLGAAAVGTELSKTANAYNSVDYYTNIAVPIPAPAPQITPAPPISIDQATVTGVTTVAELDQTEVGKKSKRTNPQYWSAYVNKNSGFVIAGCSLSYSAAQARVMAGGDVLAISQSAAYALVKFSGNYVGPEIHRGGKGYYLPLYHVRHGGSHVFFLGGITY